MQETIHLLMEHHISKTSVGARKNTLTALRIVTKELDILMCIL
jgi:hypothetical protein